MATATKTGFHLRGADGGPVRGEVRSAGGARPAVVICHGFKGFRDWGSLPVTAERLARAGFAAVTFDFSGPRVAEGGETLDAASRVAHASCSGQLSDLDAVLAALAAGALGVRATAVGVLGHGLGGGVAILGTAAHGEIRALVTWAARAHVDRLDLPRAAAAIRAPWLIVHAAADEAVPVTEARELSTAAPGARLLVVPDSGHSFGTQHPWSGSTPAFDGVLEATVDWFASHLG